MSDHSCPLATAAAHWYDILILKHCAFWHENKFHFSLRYHSKVISVLYCSVHANTYLPINRVIFKHTHSIFMFKSCIFQFWFFEIFETLEDPYFWKHEIFYAICLHLFLFSLFSRYFFLKIFMNLRIKIQKSFCWVIQLCVLLKNSKNQNLDRFTIKVKNRGDHPTKITLYM